MKKQSKIALIIAGSIVLAGIIVCLIASIIADSEDVMLFPEKNENGDLVYRQTIGDIGKISVNTSDCDIFVKGGEDNSFIEIVNFNANYYKLSDKNGLLSFSQLNDFWSMFKFWENGFSFKGMRYILRFGDDSDGEKKIIIHLKDDIGISHINLVSSGGSITVENCDIKAEYSLSSKESTFLKNVSTDTIVNIKGLFSYAELDNVNGAAVTLTSAGKIESVIKNCTLSSFSSNFSGGELSILSCDADLLSINTDSGKVIVSDTLTDNGLFEINDGQIYLELDSDVPVKINTTSSSGLISADGKYVDNYSRNDDNPRSSFDIKITTGEAVIKYN